MAAKTISVRIAGKKGKVNIEPRKGATVADVLAEAAELLGVPFLCTLSCEVPMHTPPRLIAAAR